MAELDALTSPPHHKLAPELLAGSSAPSPIQQNTYKPVTGLLSKAAFFLLVVALLPLFPSQAPEFVNQTLLTRSWELLHLLLVGIAVSYGLFSHRNADPAAEKEALHSADSPQSYLTHLLQVSPVFDDEEPAAPSGHDENGLQMWSSRYHRGEPTVVVAPERLGDGGSVGRRLILPVRSLRSPLPHADSPRRKEAHETSSIAGVGSRSFPRGRAEIRKVAEAGPLETPAQDQEEELAAGRAAVLPSAIPWRSRSGRMDLNDENSTASAPPSPFHPICTTEADAVTFRSLSFRSQPSRPTSAISSPRRLSPSPSLSPEPRAMAGEDPWNRMPLFKPAPPPPPPPPPPPSIHRTPYPPPEEEISHRSFREERKNSNGRNRGWDDDRGWSSDLGSPRRSRLHNRSRSHAEGYFLVGRSVRTVRPKEVLQADAMADVATQVTAARREKEKKKKEEEELEDEVADASDGRDSDEASEASGEGELPGDAAAGAGMEEEEEEEGENEVDKKADEFIAKFREQIRLQRIDSIKKTAAGQRGPWKP